MDCSIPSTPQEISDLRQTPINSETVARAIAGVIKIARAKGQSLEELTQEILRDDTMLDSNQRSKLCGMLTQAWHQLP